MPLVCIHVNLNKSTYVYVYMSVHVFITCQFLLTLQTLIKGGVVVYVVDWNITVSVFEL